MSDNIPPLPPTMTKSQMQKRTIFNGGAKAGISLALDELKKELPEEYHRLLSQKKKELCNRSEFGYLGRREERLYVPSKPKYEPETKEDELEASVEDESDYRHPNDFDPDAHRNRYNYDEDWQYNDY